MNDSIFPFEISPSTSFLELHHGEVADSWIEFDLCQTRQDDRPRVRITFDRCVAVRSDWSAFEGLSGLGVVENSVWVRNLNEWQRRNYPDHPDNFARIRHYYFAGHDDVVEVLAEGHAWHYVRVPREGAP